MLFNITRKNMTNSLQRLTWILIFLYQHYIKIHAFSVRTSIPYRKHGLNTMSSSSVPSWTEVNIPMGQGMLDYSTKFRPLFEKSEFVVLNIKVPFSLNIEKMEKGLAVVTKDGPSGEKVGDVLRATTCFSMGFQGGGFASDALAFAGNVKWKKGIFETVGAPWSQIVDALVSNSPDKTDNVILVFEREIND